MTGLSQAEIESLLSYTNGLMHHVYWVSEDFCLCPEKDHLATSINFTDISERRTDFLFELITTINSWVYGKEKVKKLVDERVTECGGDIANASAFLTSLAFSKFRPGYPQGQFGELLLFNFLQYFFKSIPLLRKQRISTSVGHERYGADAVHYRRDGDDNILILGESKCYKSNYQFKNAFETSIRSIEKTFNEFNNELNLYVYDDFIEPELEVVAKRYKKGTLSNVKFELVCVVAYNENMNISGATEEEIKSNIINVIKNRCSSIDKDIYNEMVPGVLSRINYIIFPIWDLESLLSEFQTKIGATV